MKETRGLFGRPRNDKPDPSLVSADILVEQLCRPRSCRIVGIPCAPGARLLKGVRPW
jgi:hypothetical protein